MQNDRTQSTTVVIVIAAGALRRAAWEALLMQQPGLAVAGAVGAVREVARWLPSAGPVAILLDVGMEADLADLVSRANGAGVLALLDEPDAASVVPLLRAGVIGCLAADASASDLSRAIVAVGRGEIALPPGIAGRALAELARPIAQEPRAIDALTEREREVVELIAQGLTNKDVAQQLFLSVRTVEAHLRNSYAKLGVRSRTEAVLWAIRHPGEGER